jgi:cytochrome P450
MNTLLVPFSIVVAILGYRIVNLFLNYLAARKLQLPILLVPVSWQDPWWLLIAPYFSFLKHLPFNLGSWFPHSTLGWVLNDRFRTHQTLGPALVVVSPSKNEIFVADPLACEELLSKWKVWTKSPDIYKIFNVFGKNVITVNGDDWQRHRKITSHGFRESNNKIVWKQSLEQAAGLSRVWMARQQEAKRESTMIDVFKDCGIVAMHVLAAAGFGKSYAFDSGLGVQEPDPGHTMSYGSALTTILKNLMLVILFDSLSMPTFLLPPKLKQLKLATKDFKLYMKEKVSEERDFLEHGDERQNLGAILVRANEMERAEGGDSGDGKRRGVLTDDEVYGNLFVLMLAGHETTANALSYTMPLLALNPEVQVWLQEEIDSVFTGMEYDYNTVYPKLVRCLAVMVTALFFSISFQANHQPQV